MKESVAVAKEADAKKGFSPTKSDKSIQRLRNEPEGLIGSLRGVIGNIRRDGGTPSVDSIATQLSGMHTAQRAPVLLALQQTHGNRYVQQVVVGIQAKLKVGQPGDKYEQEADRVADEVMRMPEPQVQCQEEEEELIQTKLLAEQITPLVQRQVEEEEEEFLQAKSRDGASPEVAHDLESEINAIRGGGRSLSGSERAYFEPRFGYDFSGVRVHTNDRARASARALNASAYTIGSNVVFGTGQYIPGTTQGRRLLAHELTHVVQQWLEISRMSARNEAIEPTRRFIGTMPTYREQIPLISESPSPSIIARYSERVVRDESYFRDEARYLVEFDGETIEESNILRITCLEDLNNPPHEDLHFVRSLLGLGEADLSYLGDEEAEPLEDTERTRLVSTYSLRFEPVSIAAPGVTELPPWNRTETDEYWLATVLMSEASVGNRTERICVGWTVRNRLESGEYGSSIYNIAARGAYSISQEPNRQMMAIASLILMSSIPDPTGGATHFFSPRSMPNEHEASRCRPPIGSGRMHCDALHSVAGLPHRVYFPPFHDEYEFVPIEGVREAYYRFYR